MTVFFLSTELHICILPQRFPASLDRRTASFEFLHWRHDLSTGGRQQQDVFHSQGESGSAGHRTEYRDTGGRAARKGLFRHCRDSSVKQP